MTGLGVHDVGLVTIDEAAEQLGVKPATIRSWRKRYPIRSVKMEGRVLLSLNDLWNVERQTRRQSRGRPRAADTTEE